MSAATKDNGLDAANDQPAKTITKHTADFISACACAATENSRFDLVLLIQTALLAVLVGVLL